METPVIQKTRDYSIFKNLDFNKDKRRGQIEDLKKNITKEDALHAHPIIVNSKMEVIDGQHRLAAAEELGVEIYYVVTDLSYSHMLDSNLIQKQTATKDIMKFYALKDRNPDYILFRNYQMSLNIQPKALISLIFGTVSSSLIRFIKEGKFKMPSNMDQLKSIINAYEKFREYTTNKRITPPSMFSNDKFCVAFRNLVLHSDFNLELFLKKLDSRWFELKPQVDSREWSKLLVSIYNWKNSNPINLDV